MESPSLTCRLERRRQRDRGQGWSGIDYIEVIDDGDQRQLCVHFFGLIPQGLTKDDVVIEGGRRVSDIQVVKVDYHGDDRATGSNLDACLRVMVDKAGDFSTYTLRLVGGEDWPQNDQRFQKLDPRYSHAEFSFKVGCPSDFDCKEEELCPPEKRDEPEINYLAKDYSSFRQLILDRLALIMPDWQERHVPDIGIALVELLAYVGDYLSYYQDAVATEAYLDTARERISVRRHVRLVDYFLHEGCNARAWVSIATDNNTELDLSDCFFITRPGEARFANKTLSKMEDLQDVPGASYDVFEPTDKELIQLVAAHSTIFFYSWDNQECCLPRGATRATLLDGWANAEGPALAAETHYDPEDAKAPTERPRTLDLKVGNVLIFEEVLGPKTGQRADADPKRRHAVQLTSVRPIVDPVNGTPVVEIEWAVADALPFPLCISARRDAPDCRFVSNVSVATGNVVLVDNGRTTDPPEDLGLVERIVAVGTCECEGSAVEMTYLPGRYRPILERRPLTFSNPLPKHKSASEVFSANNLDARTAQPQIKVQSIPAAPEALVSLFESNDLKDPTALIAKLRNNADPIGAALRPKLSQTTLDLLNTFVVGGEPSLDLLTALTTDLNALLQAWSARRDLLSSQSDDLQFVVEMDNEGRAHLRFGDGDLGLLPEAGTRFIASYRVGNGPAGNVGADTITILVLRKTMLSGVNLTPRNPLPAKGGTASEPIAEAKLYAPGAFRNTLERAITAKDYATLTTSQGNMARADLRWTGSWYEARVAIDPAGSEEANKKLLHAIKRGLYPYGRMGYDLAVQPATYVPLQIGMTICVLPHYLRGQVEAALLEVFSNRVLPDGRLGFFHPDNLTFGEGIYLSKLIAAAQSVTGVENVKVTMFQRFDELPNQELEKGILLLGPLEIPQLDNDPSFPEHGSLGLDMRGGR
ncbi:MAG TPA: putative baseplate assembly protein [Candidatus Udaeobacter sp.]|nr:putative baseplate assembly protein [Candidatus Udaeobacter sp.]